MNCFANVLNAKNEEDKTIVKLRTDRDVLAILNRQAEATAGNVVAELTINDSRYISTEQRKKIYATIRDICEWTGDVPDYLKEIFKIDFCIETDREYFSLSDCDMTTAREFINYILEFAIKNDIALTNLAIERTDDIDKYLYLCLKYRRCCISGKKADIHHCEGSRVGMGRNRKTVDHSNLKLIALSREWHNRVHAEGEKEIFKKYRVYGITLDRATLKALNINTKEIN